MNYQMINYFKGVYPNSFKVLCDIYKSHFFEYEGFGEDHIFSAIFPDEQDMYQYLLNRKQTTDYYIVQPINPIGDDLRVPNFEVIIHDDKFEIENSMCDISFFLGYRYYKLLGDMLQLAERNKDFWKVFRDQPLMVWDMLEMI